MSAPTRPPSIDHGVVALLWAIGFGLFIYFGLLAIGAKGGFSFILALLAAGGIWIFVRTRGEDRPGA